MSPSNHNSTTPTRFAEPTGGFAVFYDLVPTLLFLTSFVALLVLNTIELFRKRRWTMTRPGGIFVPLERMVSLGMRTVACLNLSVRESWGMMDYVQTTYSSGFHIILHEHLQLSICALALATRDGIQYDEWFQEGSKNPSLIASRAKERQTYRKWVHSTEIMIHIVQALQMALGSVAGNPYFITGETWFNYTRFALNILSLFIAGGVLSWMHRLKYVDNINPIVKHRLVISTTIILLVPLYRAATSFRMVSTDALSPPSSIPPKIAFYLCQLLPELICCTISYMTDFRNMADTGTWGDSPRKRIEQGLAETPRFITYLKYFFMPWKLPKLLCKGVKSVWRKWKTRRGRLDETLDSMTEDREKLLPNASSIGWESSLELQSIGTGPTTPQLGRDLEKASVVSSYPMTLKTQNLISSSSTVRSYSSRSIPAQPLVHDIHLWKPRLPSSFSSENVH
ncbi:hypothetical protein FRC19_010064 [Serendipita sp. 401]|nr:hypothetical protein FRC19_010064 [Serendipita sp. 401]KAG9056899.1 hypothetical protein FS842_009260 [Serendipita sp. 407]